MTEETIDQTVIDIRDLTDKVVAVSAARLMSKQAGFGETDQFMLATAVSELATNIARYAGRGEITLRIARSGPRTAFTVEATDAGPGIADLGQAMRDHCSSGGSLGLGLPGVKRILDEFSIDSAPGRGTRITGRKWRT
jgi:serine/threonine-protein kinase RsbT